MSGANLYVSPGGIRMCKVCRLVRDKKRYAKRKKERLEKKAIAGLHDNDGFLIPEKTKFYKTHQAVIENIEIVNNRRKRVIDFAFIVTCEGCKKPFRLSYGKAKRSDRFCGWCNLAKAWYNGIPIYSPGLAKIKDRITRVERRICKGHPYNVFFVRCLFEGCLNDNGYVNKDTVAAARKTEYCLTHRALVFRLTAYQHIYKQLKVSLKRKRHECKKLMSFDDFVRRCKETKCHYCSSNVTRSKYNDKDGNFRTSLDKKDPSKGYTYDNTVTCCTYCNYAKGYLITYQEMVLIGLLRQKKLTQADKFLGTENWTRNSIQNQLVHRKLFEKRHLQVRS